MSKFRYVAIAPGRADGKHVGGMGKAVFLHDFLIDHQTDADGRVNYGKPVSYSWIRARFRNAPPLRTLQRWMARLREGNYIHCEIRRTVRDQGVVVRVLKQKKWPSSQLGLFPVPQPLCITSGKTCAKAVNRPSPGPATSGGTVPPKVAGRYPVKALENRGLRKR